MAALTNGVMESDFDHSEETESNEDDSIIEPKLDSVSRNLFSFFLTCLHWYLSGSACEINCKLMIPRFEGYMGLLTRIDHTEWERLSVFYQGVEQEIEDARSIPQPTEFDIV
jgi:hypothetical protein